MGLDGRPLTTLSSVILTSGPFIFLWSTLKGYVGRHGPMTLARQFTRLNNQLYALFSLGLGYLILNDMFHFQEDVKVASSDLAYIYHLSKIYEYMDVFNLVAQGVTIGPHMAFHHLTTPFLTYFRVLNASDWQIFALLNCFHHFWMYAYFGGVSFFRPILPVTGYAQLAACIALDIYWLAGHGLETDESTNRLITILLLGRYAVLFTNELRTGSQQKQPQTQKEE